MLTVFNERHAKISLFTNPDELEPNRKKIYSLIRAGPYGQAPTGRQRNTDERVQILYFIRKSKIVNPMLAPLDIYPTG